MNKHWSELNKLMQSQLKKRESFGEGKNTLFKLRNELFETVLAFKSELSREDFDAMPFMNADGHHCKNVAYSLWHIFRIEDIVAHTLINDDEQIFFTGGFQKRMDSPIITTGNELVKQEIADFTKYLDLEELYSYISQVKKTTEDIIRQMGYDLLKLKISDERREKLEMLNVVSTDENAVWLIDYWCGKDIKGLIQMPFSRHWIMHIEACLRIIGKLKK